MDLKFSKLEVGFQSNNRYHNIPSIILTISGCNMKCISKDGFVCKYAYANENIYDEEDTIGFIEKNSDINHIVIKGGEPLLYKEQLEKFLNRIWRDDYIITIYTNGTLPILNPLSFKYRIALYVVNIGEKYLPKPGTKITNPETNAEVIFGTSDIENMKPLNINMLRNICMYSNDYLLCFRAEPRKLKQFSDKVINDICNSDDEFVNRFFENHPPKNHVVFTPRNKKEQNAVMGICFKFSKPYLEYTPIEYNKPIKVEYEN